MRFLLAFKVVLFSILVPGTVTLYIPSRIVGSLNDYSPANLLLTLPAVACIVVGLSIYLRCAWDFAVVGLGTPAPIDPPKKLVVTGLYRRNRNPMYLGVLLILLAECLFFLDSDLLIYAAAVALVFNAFVIFYEEPILVKKFGESYRDYCRKVSRWGFAFRVQPLDFD